MREWIPDCFEKDDFKDEKFVVFIGNLIIK